MASKETVADRAASIVREISANLVDLDRAASISSELMVNGLTTWNPIALNGYAGISLLFAELGAQDPSQRRHAHTYLSAALSSQRTSPATGLHRGPIALAFAAHAASASFGGYSDFLGKADRAICKYAREQSSYYRERVESGFCVGDYAGYELEEGLSGVGRYLLARYQVSNNSEVAEALTEILDALVSIAISDDVVFGTQRVPAWWVCHDMLKREDGKGHLNFGLAHGICGPLAFLALAYRYDFRVPGHREAMTRIVDLLLAWKDPEAPHWPRFTSDYSNPQKAKKDFWQAWCYGAAGIGRSLYLAGSAVSNADWQRQAHSALSFAFREGYRKETVYRLSDDWGGPIMHNNICHGWAGILQIMLRMTMETGNEFYGEAAEMAVQKLTDAYHPESSFGYHYWDKGGNRAGFMDGNSGIALALYSYVNGAPRSNWDAILLLN